MKLMLINTLYYPNIFGGAERSVQFLAEALVQKGHQVVVVSAHPGLEDVKKELVNGVRVYYIKLKNIYWPFSGRKQPFWARGAWHLLDIYNPLMSRELSRIIREEKPDLVHTNNLAGFSVAVWKVVKEFNLPLVHTIRDYYLLCPASKMYKDGKNCDHICTKCQLFSISKIKLSAHVDTVVGNSKFILERHLQEKVFDRAKKEVIYNAYKTTASGEKLNGGRKGCIFGFIGRLDPTKGIELLLKVFNEVSIFNKYTLLVAGTGLQDYVAHLKSISNNNVHYLGFMPSAEFYRQVDILIVPSLWHEPLPRTIFEAYAHGIPVVGSRRGGIPEIIEEGKTGFVFEPDDLSSLVKAMSKLLHKDLRATMREQCLAKAEQFTPEKIVGDYLQVYEEALAGF